MSSRIDSDDDTPPQRAGNINDYTILKPVLVGVRMMIMLMMVMVVMVIAMMIHDEREISLHTLRRATKNLSFFISSLLI